MTALKSVVSLGKLQELTRVGVYYVYVLTGFLMIWLCPDSLAPAFLSVYPVGNLFSSLLVYLFYTNGRSKLFDVLAFGMIALLAVISLILQRLEPAYVALSLAIIITDYSSSQSFSPNRLASTRTLLALSAIALPFSFVGYIAIRLVSSLGVLAWSIAGKSYPEEEGLRRLQPPTGKVFAVALSNGIYFIPLILIGNVGITSAKTAYLTYAIGATCLLRLIDFEIKHSLSGEDARLSAIFYSAAAVCAVVFTFLAYHIDWRYLAMLAALPALSWLRMLYLRLGWF